ncbi:MULTISPECIES: hypothetical protein [unclassified Streptomyces]|uniref:hypothetical protein n=1 Tax=unclassified Streptomyces TaxID=2593676 RepID=UPI003656EFE8
MRSLTYDIEFRARAKKTMGWGFALLSAAALLWVWCAVLLAMPYTVGDDRECEARLFTEWGTANEGGDGSSCAEERDWPEALAVLGLSVPVSVVGAVLYTSGSVSNRMSEHAAEITRLNEAADRSGKQG